MPHAEWDWPPRHQQPPRPIEGRIRAERIIPPRAKRRGQGRGYRIARKTRDGFNAGVFGLARLIFALVMAGFLGGAILLLGAIIRA